MSTSTIGIDVSKDWLDVATADGEDRFRVATDRAGPRRSAWRHPAATSAW